MPSLRIQLSALAAAVLGAAAVQAAPSHGGVAAVSSASQTGSGEGDVKIGIMDTISTAVDTASLREGLVLLSNPLEKDFRISWRDIVTPDAAQEVLHQKPDFLMLPTEQIDLMEEQGVQTFRIATRKPWTATDAAHAVGSLVVTRADRTDINTLEDLAGRHIAADTPTSLTGWLALQGEIARAGHDPEKFFGMRKFFGSEFSTDFKAKENIFVNTAPLQKMIFLKHVSYSGAAGRYRFSVQSNGTTFRDEKAGD